MVARFSSLGSLYVRRPVRVSVVFAIEKKRKTHAVAKKPPAVDV